MALIPESVRGDAMVAIQREVMTVLQGPGRAPRPVETFSRVRVVPRSLNSYTMTITESAPGGVKMDPVRIPFEVRQPSAKDASSNVPTVFVSGFYDATSKTVQLYSAAGKTYVAAAEHPFIKARLPKK